jgi:sugar phosphate isomerase/epimerase
MIKPEPFRISNSITDFSPLFWDLEYLFKRLKATGVDGIELVIGIKSRWNPKRIKYLSQKYDLPISSIHQPAWSGLGGMFFDESFVDLALAFGAKGITFHPLPGISFTHPRMKAYLQKLSLLQEKKGVEIFLENLPLSYEPKFINHLIRPIKDTMDVEEVCRVTKEYGIKMTLDIDHLSQKAPHELAWFHRVLPNIGNIHISSFTPQKSHMPLYLGNFQTKEFVNALHKANYKGLLTLELQYPRLITLFNYDFEMVKKSVELVKSV